MKAIILHRDGEDIAFIDFSINTNIITGCLENLTLSPHYISILLSRSEGLSDCYILVSMATGIVYISTSDGITMYRLDAVEVDLDPNTYQYTRREDTDRVDCDALCNLERMIEKGIKYDSPKDIPKNSITQPYCIDWSEWRDRSMETPTSAMAYGLAMHIYKRDGLPGIEYVSCLME